MGVVYEAQDLRLPRSVAIKFLKPGRDLDLEAVRRFKREARLASSLNHQNICTILDVDEDDALSFIAMELLRGVSLKARLAAGPFSFIEILHVATQVAEGLSAAHAQGIVHRDLSPGNVFLCESGVVKLLDFGLAKRFATADDEGSDDLTTVGRVVGTIHYMAPEQLRGPATVDHRCDLFSLGALLYQMTTGARPFEAPSTGDVATLIQCEPHVPVRQLRPGSPHALERIIDTLLQKAPDDRFASAAALLNALRDLRDSRPDTKRTAVEPTNELSVAVLPFRLVGSAHSSVAAFSEGLLEDLSAQLGGLSRVRVAPRTSVRALAGLTVRDVAQRLSVSLVVEGSVQQVGDELRVLTQLIQAEEERMVGAPVDVRHRAEWSLETQGTVAAAIVEGLRQPLSATTPVLTSDPEALHAFKRGQHHWLTTASSGGWRNAIDYFQDAIARDPRFVQAHVAIARAYNFLGYYCIIRPTLAFTVAAQAAERALSLDERCAAAHTELASVRFGRDWDWSAAESSFRRAIELDAADPWAHIHYSWLLALVGRTDAGLAEAEKGLALASAVPVVAAGRAHTLYLARRFAEAVGVCDEVLAAVPGYVFALHMRGLCHLCLREGARAIDDFERVAVLSNRTPFYLGLLGLCYGEFGERQKGLDLLAELNELSQHTYVHPQCYTFVYSGLQSREKIIFQEQAYEHGASPLNYLTPFVRELYELDPHRPTRFDQMRLIE